MVTPSQDEQAFLAELRDDLASASALARAGFEPGQRPQLEDVRRVEAQTIALVHDIAPEGKERGHLVDAVRAAARDLNRELGHGRLGALPWIVCVLAVILPYSALRGTSAVTARLARNPHQHLIDDSRRGDVEAMLDDIRAGANVNVIDSADGTPPRYTGNPAGQGATPLMLAAQSGRMEAVRLLLSCSRLDLSARDANRNTARTYAAPNSAIDGLLGAKGVPRY